MQFLNCGQRNPKKTIGEKLRKIEEPQQRQKKQKKYFTIFGVNFQFSKMDVVKRKRTGVGHLAWGARLR